MPSAPSTRQSTSFSGGAAKSTNMRAVSAPNFSASMSAPTTLPLDLDILAPSAITMPWVKRRRAGSLFVIRPMSRITLVKKRE